MGITKKDPQKILKVCGAENGIRTRDLNLGKVALYQLSYFRVGIAKIVRKTESAKKIPKISIFLYNSSL